MKPTPKNYPADENEFDKRAKEMHNPNVFKPKWRGVGARTKTRPEKVVIRDTKTGKRYGTRTLIQKTTSERKEFKTISQLLERDDITLLPDSVISEIKKNIRSGAKDLQQNWENALELVFKAYQVANVRLPTSQEKGAWKQFQDIIKYAVQQLIATRGINGKWRMTSTIVSEAELPKEEKPTPVKNRRFFVMVPGESAVEVEENSMDDIIDRLTNKLRRRGVKTRVEERAKKHVILSVWDDDVKIEKITIKEIS